jgi:hypothetical protein
VRNAVRFLLRQQSRAGGWSTTGRGAPPTIDDTAAVVQALVAAGRRTSASTRRGMRWVIGRQNRDGGFPLSPGAPSNAQSTAWAVQALAAVRRNPRRVRRNGSRSPDAYLRSLQAPDGSVRYSRSSAQTPTWVTAQAVAALAGKPLPVRAPSRRASSSSAQRDEPAASGDAGSPDMKRERRRASGRSRGATGRNAVRELAPVTRRAGALVGLVLHPVVK